MLESYTDEEFDEILERQKDLIRGALNSSVEWEEDFCLFLLFKYIPTGTITLLDISQDSVMVVDFLDEEHPLGPMWEYSHLKSVKFYQEINLPYEVSSGFLFEYDVNVTTFLSLLNRESILHLELVSDDDHAKMSEIWNKYRRLRND